MIIPLLGLGVAGIFAITGCKSDGTDTNTSGTTPTVASAATNQATYEAAGYTTYKSECFDTTVSGIDAYGRNYLFIKESSTVSPRAGYELAADTTADLDIVLAMYTYLVCDKQPLVTQILTATVDITSDASADVGDNSIEQTAKFIMHVSDVQITPGANSIVYAFATTQNGNLSTDDGDKVSINQDDTNYAANGFCGLTSWTVGTASDPRLPGELPTGDATVDSYYDIQYTAYGGLGDCALPAKGDTTHDVSSYTAGNAFGSLQTNTYVTDYVGFDTDEGFDLSTLDATDDSHFLSELETIWMTGLGNVGGGAYNINVTVGFTNLSWVGTMCTLMTPTGAPPYTYGAGQDETTDACTNAATDVYGWATDASTDASSYSTVSAYAVSTIQGLLSTAFTSIPDNKYLGDAKYTFKKAN